MTEGTAHIAARANPRTGESLSPVAPDDGHDEVDAVVAATSATASALDDAGRGGRAALLRRVATDLEARHDEVLVVCDEETALGAARLSGELARTCHQLRFVAEVLDEGSYLEAAVDTAGGTGAGRRPDIRRMLVPIGPVAVFGASNFPLAFSVIGGDTASALAAGNPVVVKAHESHPATSRLVAETVRQSAATEGFPADCLGLVFGVEAGRDLVCHPGIRAVGFTGSPRGGRTLLDLVNGRPDPIPLYAEMGSPNPVVVTDAAAAEGPERLATTLVGSVTASSGQLCTKPGLIFVPRTANGDRLVEAMVDVLGRVDPVPLLTRRILDDHRTALDRLDAAPGLRILTRRRSFPDGGFHPVPTLAEIDVEALTGVVAEERFGPLAVIVRHDEGTVADAVLDCGGSLTASIFHGRAEPVVDLAARLRSIAGRLVFDDVPTGVAVTWGQHHGGPWPATNTVHTSVGATAIRRFLRPVVWQDAPQEVLPPELRDHATGLVRRDDGVLRHRS